MPYEVPLSGRLQVQLWKVKVLDREIPREEPHVTIIRKKQRWRDAIRTAAFLDDVPSPRDVPAEVLDAIRADHVHLVAPWNRLHPHNPI